MKVWIYCDNCDKRQPLAGGLQLNAVGEWKDLCCAVCRFIAATISAGDDQGNRPPV